ncbi:MAG: Deoxyribose-phosphate aldolase (modular protein) [Anaerolineales bacterium]|jgi:deoxyribose-phosphate aldolase|nr:Deoxyribose-phosphate aldolase (modular protein) [Anaerolineales bacterium]
MRTLDDATLDRLIEQITRNVLVLLEEDASAPPNPAPALSPLNFAEHLRPVVHAGADRIGTTLGVAPTDGQLGHMIDHTLLKPDATQDQIAQLCFEARKFSFASVCVNPSYVRLCAELLKGSPVVVCTVVGFPLGATPTEVKVYEAQQAIRDGATEIDMVINVGAVKSRDYELAERDIASVAHACRAGNALLKVILEAALLTDEEKVIACQLAKVAGADYVKTSTGFGPGGATAADVALMRRVVGPTIGVKAAGGIRTLADAQEMIAAGASRLGASASVKIMQEAAS